MKRSAHEIYAKVIVATLAGLLAQAGFPQADPFLGLHHPP